MKVLGIIVEYNPFHNGHIFHIKKAKEIVQPDYTIAIMSSSFVQRGEPAIIDKFIRSQLAVDYGVDLVIELPLVYAVESADYFASGSIQLLNEFHITDLVFGSECGDIDTFKDIALSIKNNQPLYDEYIKDSMDKGYRYPDACNLALEKIMGRSIVTPNDLLGLAYVKEVINNNYPIECHCITRTNDYHDLELNDIASATSIRNAMFNHQDVAHYLPFSEIYKENHLFSLNDFYPYLKYQILFSTEEELRSIHLVEEGLENLLKKSILETSSIDELIHLLTSKRYTRSRIQRMLVHILLNNKKEEITEAMNLDYIRVLALNSNGRKYIKLSKEQTTYNIISNYSSHKHIALSIELRAAKLLSLIDEKQYKKEYQSIPYIKED